VLLGMDAERRTLMLPSSGTLGFLPGIPPRCHRPSGYVAARVDYLYQLYSSSSAYLAASGGIRRSRISRS
jgi:hypothetical protein